MNKEINLRDLSLVINVFNVAYVKRIVHNNVFQIIKFNKNVVYIVDYVMKKCPVQAIEVKYCNIHTLAKVIDNIRERMQSDDSFSYSYFR